MICDSTLRSAWPHPRDSLHRDSENEPSTGGIRQTVQVYASDLRSVLIRLYAIEAPALATSISFAYNKMIFRL